MIIKTTTPYLSKFIGFTAHSKTWNMHGKQSQYLTRESRVLHQVELLPPLLLRDADRAGLPLLGRGGQGEEP